MPGLSRPLKEGEEWVCDESAYNLLHEFETSTFLILTVLDYCLRNVLQIFHALALIQCQIMKEIIELHSR